MAGSMNRVTLVGNLGDAPKISTVNGETVANLSVATTERWTDRATGERREATEWHRVQLWGPPATFAERYLKKGASVLIEGKLKTRKWTDRDGIDRYATEVVVNGPRGGIQSLDRRDAGDDAPASAPAREPLRMSAPAGPADDLGEDEVPF